MMNNEDKGVLKSPPSISTNTYIRKNYKIKIQKTEELSDTEKRKLLELKADFMSDCMDCLCRTCTHNVCAEGELCAGCNECNGNIVDTEEDCPRNMYEYMGD